MNIADVSSKRISVMLVDDHPIVRDGFSHLLANEPDIYILAEASDGETACVNYRAQKPDVVVLDLCLPGIDGLEVIHRIKAQDPKAAILVFSMHANEVMVQRALDAGAMGYLDKQCGLGQIVTAVRQVAQGKHFVSSEHASGMLQRNSSTDPLGTLSPREFQLFGLFADGRSVAEIAMVLSISPRTVGVHRTNIMHKLNIGNTYQLMRLAATCGINQQ